MLYNNLKANGEIRLGFGGGNKIDANFWFDLQKYIFTVAQYSIDIDGGFMSIQLGAWLVLIGDCENILMNVF